MTCRPHPGRRAFTLVELLTVIAILSLLLSVLMPSLERARGRGRMACCAANLHSIGNALASYMASFRGIFPYGVPKPAEICNHPHYETWRPDEQRGGGIPPQQQFFSMGLVQQHQMWICPNDPSPKNYNWWDYDVHPDIREGSSYMFSEQGLFGVVWWTKRVFTAGMVRDPSSFGYAADGRMCPNGWHWDAVDPEYELTRIDWTHEGKANFLWGDGHMDPRPQFGSGALIRSNPCRLNPLDTGGWP